MKKIMTVGSSAMVGQQPEPKGGKRAKVQWLEPTELAFNSKETSGRAESSSAW